MSLLIQTTSDVTNAANATVSTLAGNVVWLVFGIILIGIAVFIILQLKNIIVNTVLGLIGWGILTYVLGIHLPFWPSLIVSAIFGLAGLGVMLVLAFLGVV